MDALILIDSKRLGLACGIAASVFYVSCVLAMAVVGREPLILYFNSVLHGLDVSSVLRAKIGPLESLFGLINIMALGWLFGAFTGAFYNFANRLGINSGDKGKTTL